MLDSLNAKTVSSFVDNVKQGGKLNFEDAMTLTGFGKFNVFSVMFCGFMLLGMIMETLGFSYIIPASHCDLELNLMQKTWISVIPFIAIIATSHMWGYLADTRGRKKILLLCMSIASVVSILSSLSPNTITFAILRFIAGIFVAGPSALGYAYLGELTPRKQRDTILTLGNASVGFGTAIVPLIAWGILPFDFHLDLVYIDFRPWRLLICIFALPYAISSLIMLKFPESPKFLAAQGKHNEAMEILKDIYAINSGNHRDTFPVFSLKSEHSGDVGKKKSFLKDVWSQTVPLFRKRYLKYTALTCYLQFVVFAATNGFYIWFPMVINKLLSQKSSYDSTGDNLCSMFSQDIINGDNSNITDRVEVCDDSLNTGAFTVTIILSLIVTALTIGAAFLMRLIEKRIILFCVFLTTTLSSFVVHWMTGTMLSISVFSTILINGVCIGVITSYVVEIFPTNFRAMAVCLTLMVGRLGSMFGSNIIGYLLHTDCPVTFFLYSGLLLSCTLLAFCLPISEARRELKTITNNNNITSA